MVATRSHDKLLEIRRILADVPDLEVVDLTEAGVAPEAAEEALEPHETFEENALSKARWFHARTGLPTVADDSGLEVDALGGAPGVRSKRFAPVEGLSGKALDEANNRHLLGLLEGVPEAERGARYVCVAVMVAGEGAPVVCRGEAPGRILGEPRGRGGFGYDPLFLDPGLGVTFAQISREEKNARSHRGRAFRAVAQRLKQGR
ncbi:MAG: non-canonical purine NTP pyrophosphatase [Gemmatimonadota bacterium]